MVVICCLDAYSCAAAGQKLTLDKGLGREKLPIKKKGKESSPALLRSRF
jgi:hypothetical protein